MLGFELFTVVVGKLLITAYEIVSNQYPKFIILSTFKSINQQRKAIN